MPVASYWLDTTLQQIPAGTYTDTTGTITTTNQLPFSTDASGNVYNGVGYKADTYLSGGSEGTKSGIYATGFIPCAVGDTLYCKNVGMQTGQDSIITVNEEIT